MRRYIAAFLAITIMVSAIGGISVAWADETAKAESVSALQVSPDGFSDEQIADEKILDETGVEAATEQPLLSAGSSVPEQEAFELSKVQTNAIKNEEESERAAAVTQKSNLKEVLKKAQELGFCYVFRGDDQIFDGNRIIDGTEEDIARLRASDKGTLLVRFFTEEIGNQVLFAAGNNYGENNYGAIMANNSEKNSYQRVDFPNGMVANLADTSTKGGWHTFVYSVDATDPVSTQGKSVTSFDGSVTTQFPNFASWFNANETIQNIQYLTIGGAHGSFAKSGSNVNFNGKIAFAAFLPDTVTQEEAAALSSSEWSDLIYSAENITIQNAADAVVLDDETLSELLALDNMSVIVKYKNTSKGVASLFSVSDRSKVNSHFHVYEYNNTLGFEFRNNDAPKYTATCGNVASGAVNTIAFKAEADQGYKLFANGVLGATLPKNREAYQFLTDLSGPNAAYIGKTERSNDLNSYLFEGEILSIEICGTVLSDEYLIERTGETEWKDSRVFRFGDTTGAKFFRIPFLLRTKGDTLIAGADTNFGSTGDSAENIDTAIRIKPNASVHDALEGWEEASVPYSLHMQDYADDIGYRQQSASFIDGMIVEDSVYTDRVLMIIDAWAWNGGLFSWLNVNASGQAQGGNMRAIAPGDGFCTIGEKKYLLLSSENIMGSDGHGKNNINNNITRSKFGYAADIYGEKSEEGRYNIYHLEGVPAEYSSTGPVDDSHLRLGELSEYSLSNEYELYKNGTMLTVKQRTSDTVYTDTDVPMKLFYKDSELQMYNTSYLLQIYSDDEGRTWHTDKLLNGMVKPENTTYLITGPGKGIQLKNGAYQGRIVMPVYYQFVGTSPSRTGTIYSDDGGVTWKHGDALPISGTSEAALVELPNGSIQIFARNATGSGGKYITAASNDGGVTWVEARSALGDTEAGVNSQLSAIALSVNVPDPNDPGKAYPALLMTSAYNSARTNGRTWIGLIKEDGTYENNITRYRIDWAYNYELTGNNSLFAYSCMAELGNNKVGLLYETSPDGSWVTGLQGMYYKELSIEELCR